MGLGCGATTARFLLFTFNIILWICGVILVGVGIWLVADPGAWGYVDVINEAGMDDPLLAKAVYVMIGVGVFIFLVGGAGCWGACQKSSCWLMVYAVLIGLVLFIQIIAAILAGIYRGKVTDAINEEMVEQVKEKYSVNASLSLTEAWDTMQKDLKCCGSNNYTDYKNSYYMNSTKDSVPLSCCVFKDGEAENPTQCRADASASSTDSQFLHTTGCYEELKDNIKSSAGIIIGVLVGIALIELLGLIMACCLRRSIIDDQNKYQ